MEDDGRPVGYVQCTAYPVVYFGEQLRRQRDRRRVVRFLLGRTSSNRDLFRVVDAREIL